MTTIFDRIKTDLEVGTKGDFSKVRDHEWSLDTDGENAFYVIGPNNRPLAIVAVEKAFGMDHINDADMRRFCRLPQLERIALVAEDNDAMFEDIRDCLNGVLNTLRPGPDGEGQDEIDVLKAIISDCETHMAKHAEACK